MKKCEVIEHIGGGSMSEVARFMGISRQAVSQWPEELSTVTRLAVYGACYLAGREADDLEKAEQSREL